VSYSEQNGQVVLTMSKEDYAAIIFALGMSAGQSMKDGRDLTGHLALLNRLNEGNPDYTPYQVGEKKC
jgi:hypothetical protein